MRALRWLGLGVLVLVALLAAGIGFLQTGPGKDLVVSRLAPMLGAELGRVEGTIPFDMRVDRVALKDESGAWLEARGFRLDVVATALLSGRLEIAELSFDRVDVLRKPLPKEEPKPASGPPKLAIPDLPFDVVVRQARIGELRLAPSVLGQEVVATASAESSVVGGEGAARLRLERTDGTAGHLSLDLKLANETLQLALAAEEPSGLFGAPISTKLSGEGPLSDWRGSLALVATGRGAIDAALHLAGDELTIDGNARDLEILPPDVKPLVGDRVPFQVTLAGVFGDHLAIPRFAAELASGRVEGSADLGDRAKAEVKLDVPDLAPFSALAGGEIAGVLHADVSVAWPEVTIRLDVAKPRFAEHGAERLGAALVANVGESREVKGEGRIEDLAGRTIDWTVDAALHGDDLVLRRFTAADGTSKVAVQGERKGGRINAEASIDAPALDVYADLLQRPLKGRVSAKVTAQQAEGEPLAAMVDALLGDVAVGVDTADRLLSGEVRIDGAAKRGTDGVFVIERLKIAGPSLEASAHGRVQPDLDLAFDALLPQLDAALPGASGRVAASGTASGTIEAPRLEAKITGSGLTQGEARLDELAATVALDSTAPLSGKIDGSFRADKLNGTLRGAFSLDGDKLALSGVNLAAGGATASADMTVSLEQLAANGTLRAKVPDLAPWSALAGQKLAGSLDLDAKLAGHAVDLKLSGSRIAAGETKVERLAMTASLKDLLGTPSGRADGTVTGAKLGPATIETARLRAESRKPGEIAFSLDSRGEYREKLQLTLSGEARLKEGEQRVRIDRMEATAAGEKMALRRPLEVTRRGNDLSLANLDLAVANGSLTGSAALRNGGIEAKLVADRLSIAPLARLGGFDGVTGVVGAELNATGRLERPTGRLLLQGRELRFAALSRPDLPPFAVSVEGNFRDGRIDARGRVDGPQGAAIGFAGNGPFGTAFPPGAPISLKLEGAGELANLVDLLPVGEDRLSGQFHLDVAVRGTLAAPKGDGVFRVENGRYESLDLGTVLSDISVEIVGKDDRFELRRFFAHDGAKGEVQGKGAVVLSAKPAPSFDVSAQLQRFRLVRRDAMSLNVSGEARVQGSLTQPVVRARLRVNEGEVRVDERRGPSITQLDVIEINSRTGQRITPEKKAIDKEPTLPATLDVVVEIPGQLFVRGKGLESEWQGRVAVKGTSAAPDIVGRIESVRGSFDLLGKRFALSRGIISFDGGAKIDPRLDLLAEANASGVTAQAQISGSASSPSMTLTSSPMLPQDEVLARVLFGRGVGQLTPTQGIQLAQAAATLTSGGPGLLDKMRGKLGLDRLDVGGGTEGSTDPGISAGKYLREGVFVGVDQSVSGQSKAKVEVEVTPNITVETDVGSKGGAGLGLNWKLDY
jgi:translocation and assembly module TamB